MEQDSVVRGFRRWMFHLCCMALLAAMTTATIGAQPRPANAPACSIAYSLPGDIPASSGQAQVDAYSWQLFLALNAPAIGQSVSTTGDNATLWGGTASTPITPGKPGWSSTNDLLQAVTTTSVPPYGAHDYPDKCKAVPGFQNFRVIDQLKKVDDSFFEAKVNGLSNSPVAATNGAFLRYEILISPVTYNTIKNNKLYLTSVLNTLTAPVSFPCGLLSAGGPKGDPANPGIGAITLKNAWMDVTNQPGAAAGYHTEKLLVYTSAGESSTGTDSCQLKTMALVGMHIAHKTTQQQGWTWSTFEHSANAPDCQGQLAKGNGVPGAPGNANCPATPLSGGPYNLFSAAGGSQAQTCNTPPAQNAPAGSQCNDGYCADLPPNAILGFSQLCRQVPLNNYATAFAQSQACNAATGKASVWSNYALVSTQWFTGSITAPTTCGNVVPQLNPKNVNSSYRPLITASDNTSQIPFLANTSMESYERSVCIGCHQQALVNTNNNANSVSDFMYFLQLEVPAAPVNNANGALGRFSREARRASLRRKK